jgi:DnaA-homolog protein
MNSLKQLTLDLCLKDDANIANFFIGANKQLIDMLGCFHDNKEVSFIYLWGANGTGKSHLLSALCQLFGEHNKLSVYLPLEEEYQLKPQILDEMENFDLLCIDDLDLIAGDLFWEERIFHCFNKIMENGKKIVITANTTPHFLAMVLRDLQSRLTGGLIFELKPLTDADKIASLKLRANLRGLELNDAVANFLLSHYARDTKNLFKTLETLDKEALAAQRKITIPFVKNVLG